MDELLRQGTFILRGMWHRRWIGLAVAWIVGIGAAFMILRIPDKYEASARIYVDTQSVLKPLMSGLAVQPNVEQQLMILSRTLISRPNVEKLVHMADLDLNAKDKQEIDRMIDDLMRTLQISSAGRDNLYTLSYRSSQPAQAKRVVQSLTSIFVESSLGGKRKDTDSAKKFIEDQIKVYEKKLEEAEARLKEFKLKHMNLANADGTSYSGRLVDVGNELQSAKLQLKEAENSRDALKRQIEGEEPVFLPEAASEQPQAAITTELDGRIDALKRGLDAMRLRYTDEHPDVQGTKRVIADLEAQRAQILAARQQKTSSPSGPKHTPVNTNPVYQSLKVSLAEAEANVASLRTRVAEYETRFAALRESSRLVPQIEAEFAQLNRDYEVNKRNYESLVSRRESAEISGEMEAASGVAEFRLIDPPRVSPQPVAPNRFVLFPLALLGALGAGLLVSLVASQLWPTFLDARSLREATGLPILGSVSMLVDEKRRKKERRGILAFLSAFLALIGSFAGGLLMLALLAGRAA